MAAPYPAIAIANEFIRRSKNGLPLTPMKLLKLVYFAEGWYLGYHNSSLIEESFQAWTYGPVIYSLYQALRDYGDQPIPGFIGFFEDADEDDAVFCDPDDLAAKGMIDAVWQTYGHMTASKLSNLTHAKGTPWRKIYDSNGGTLPPFQKISKDDMRDYFKSLIDKANE